MHEAATPERSEAPSGTAATHGQIFGADGGALHVHLHRDHGLAHRHLVLSSGQIRALRILFSRPVLFLLTVLILSMGWISAQAARVPMLKQEVVALTNDLARVDSLTKTLEQLQANYQRLQAMLGAGTAGATAAPGTSPAAASPRTPSR
ncbi:MAG: hypothetical protein RL625_1422 [Gemmatimonadota bacterium]